MANNNERENFEEIASDTILEIIDTIEKYDPAGVIQIEVESDIITFTIPGGKQYVLNKHNNYKEIWLVSPISGPYHFGYLNNNWVDKNNVVLADLLSKELSQFINKVKFFL
jgi:iron donor protein CyaY